MSLMLYHDVYKSESENPLSLVLLHGWGLNGLVWDDIMPLLLKQFEVTLIELPGFGRSPMPGGDYTLDYLTEHVLAVAPKRAIWMGWSLGGVVATHIAAQFPERVEALISVATNAKFVADESWHNAMPNADFEQFYSFLLEDWQGTLIRFLALQCKDSDTMREDVRKLREMLFFHGLPATKALRCGLDILRATDLRPALEKITAPILFVLGEKDNLVPMKVGSELKQVAAGSDVSVIGGAAHIPFISDPDLFMQAVDDFLAENHLKSADS